MFVSHKKPVQIFSVCLEYFQTANTDSLKACCHTINVFALEEISFRFFELELKADNNKICSICTF